jgi:hypothetical protein
VRYCVSISCDGNNLEHMVNTSHQNAIDAEREDTVFWGLRASGMRLRKAT